MTIAKITLENFKCFEALEFPCAPLTLLTGFNASGKSTVLQALLLLTQGLRVGLQTNLLPLNGDFVSLGSGGDVVRHYSADPTIRLGVKTDEEEILWHFATMKELSARGLLGVVDVGYENGDGVKNWKAELLPAEVREAPVVATLQSIVFVGAARGRQRETFPVPRVPGGRAGDVGAEGEYGAYWYLEGADDEVDRARRHPSDDRETVRSQVEAWVNDLFPGGRVKVDRLAADAPVQLTFSTSKTSPWSKPANVGFGLNYVFPMLVAVLTARKGTVVVVDSAEAHLHPRAQSAVGRLLAQMANAGLQIFLETHSDHLLNGVRLAVRQGLLAPEHAAVHFFGAGEDAGNVTAISIDRNGAVSDWPEGFFDQTERDLAVLSGWA